MPRAALRPDEVALFRAKVSEAAMHLFAQHGYEAVTMRAVAAELGCSPMTPYRYLAGKEELFVLVRVEAFKRFADRLEHALGRPGQGQDDAVARLRKLKRAYVRFALDEPDAYRIMFELRQPDPGNHPDLLAQSRRAFGCLHRTVQEAVSAGHLRGDPLTLAHLLWANTHGLVSLHLAGRLTLGRSIETLAAIDHELPPARNQKEKQS
jgi:AcrR family transcriptional regulator